MTTRTETPVELSLRLAGGAPDASRPASEDDEETVTFDPHAPELTRPLDWRAASAVAAGMCFVFGLLECSSNFLFVSLGPNPRSYWSVLRGSMPWWILWMAFMPLVLWLARRHRFDDARWRRSATLHTAAAVLLSLAHGTAFGISYFYVASEPAIGSVLNSVRIFLSRYLFTDILTYAAAVSTYYAFEYFFYFRRSALAVARTEARAARLQLSLAEARLHALRMELNPHFLFNALNAAAGLVRRREHDAAVDMLARVGDLLRTTLDREMPTEVPLAQELALLRRFLDIELVRFGDRLRVAWDVDPDVADALVPPLILQPLVENALRHGISRRPGAALLRISARRAGLQLELAVRDTGDGLAPHGGRPPREGIGLSNVRARLEELYGPEMTSLELTDVAGGGARARLLLPFHLSRERPDVARGA